MKNIGVISMGIKLPILSNGDDLIECVIESVAKASKEIKLQIEDNDIIAVTESIVARTQGEYATVTDMTHTIKYMFNHNSFRRMNECIALYQPVLSRNRFAIILRAIARATKKVFIQFTAPCDEVGNEIVDKEWFMLNEDHLSEQELCEAAEQYKHKFTGVNYIEYYRSIVEGEGSSFEYVISNKKDYIKNVSDNIIICNVHDRDILKKYYPNAKTLEDVKIGSNKWGVLGSNKVDEETVKLFPNYAQEFAEDLQNAIYQETEKDVHVLVYGDGGFKCPVCGVWEELDPVISPGYTEKLNGTPNELKLKYLADNSDKVMDDLVKEIKKKIKNKNDNLVGDMSSQGTTPRKYSDLLGSLADLTSGSGDKGTPVVWIKNYFKNYSDN